MWDAWRPVCYSIVLARAARLTDAATALTIVDASDVPRLQAHFPRHIRLRPLETSISPWHGFLA
jgi:hypothetical protein